MTPPAQHSKTVTYEFERAPGKHTTLSLKLPLDQHMKDQLRGLRDRGFVLIRRKEG
jgi:hypothetical protein